MITFETISQYNAYNNYETLHPLVTIVDYSKALPRQRFSANFGLYAIKLKDVKYGTPERYEQLLSDYFKSDKPQANGLSSVAWCASELNLSANYFGDLIKKETGKSAQEYIQTKLIDVTKKRIFDTQKMVSEIAYELGFKYPQHSARLFKQRVGYSPSEYRTRN